jgi:nucleoside diphosphate kinase
MREREVFVLLGPDAVVRHAAVPILDRMTASRFIPVRHKMLWRRPDHLDEFHAVKIKSAWDVYLYRLVDMLFDYGPYIALVMEDTGQDGEDGHARMRRLKGASDPYDAEPSSIGRDFGAVNLMLSLVHSADSPADSARESAVFMANDCAATLTEARSMCQLVTASVPMETRDFGAVLAGLRRRLIALSWPDLTAEQRGMAGKLLAADNAGMTAPGSGERLARLLPDGLRHPLASLLASLLACDFDPGAPLLDLPAAGHLMRAYCACLDPWERLTLATSLYFRPYRCGLPPGNIPAERAS